MELNNQDIHRIVQSPQGIPSDVPIKPEFLDKLKNEAPRNLKDVLLIFGESPQKVSDVRKRHLDLVETKSPISKSRVSSYENSPLGKKAVTIKHTAGINWAAVIVGSVKTGRYMWFASVTNGYGLHSERKVLDALPDDIKENLNQIVIVYTERKPCQKGQNCYEFLKKMVPTSLILWSVEHGDPEAEKAFQLLQKSLGVRMVQTSAKRPQIAAVSEIAINALETKVKTEKETTVKPLKKLKPCVLFDDNE